MARGNKKKETGKRKIKIEPEDDSEMQEENVKKQAPPNKLRKTESYQPWRVAESAISTVPESALDHAKVEVDSVLTDEKELKLWWYDAFEKKAEGSVYLFGKVFDRNKDRYVSCSVKLQNIKREVFVLPRTFRIDYNSNQTAHQVSMDDVKVEISEILKKRNILGWEFKVTTKKYAFGIADVPSTAEYLVVEYGYNQSELPNTLSGQTFSHVFGSDTSPLEHVLLKCNIMGPCWLAFSESIFAEKAEIWCKLNAKVKGLDNCKVVKDEEDKPITKGPPLSIMSLSIETARNQLAGSNEIIIASAFVCPQVDIDDTLSLDSIKCSRFSVARKLPDKYFPDDIHEAITDVYNQKEHSIQLERTEMGLINYLLDNGSLRNRSW
ncbi:ribonuclease H-like protein [Backusella circina FSU 941]|nr:ribonuclease H-like protein [Backusella circina FSU 941]